MDFNTLDYSNFVGESMGNGIAAVFTATTTIVADYQVFNKAKIDSFLCDALNFCCFNYFKYLHYCCYYCAVIKEQYSQVITVNWLIIVIINWQITYQANLLQFMYVIVTYYSH